MIVTDLRKLQEVVDRFMAYEAFAFDLETRYVPTEDERRRRAEIEAKRTADRTADEQWWLDLHLLAPTDPLRNEIMWISLASYGEGVAVPVCHPHGRLLKAQRRVKLPACDVYPADDPRRLTRTGKLSTRSVQVTLPAEFAAPPPQPNVDAVIEILRPLFFSGKRIIGHNVKFDLKTISKYFGEFPPPPYADTILVQHLLDERLPDYKLGRLAKNNLGYTYEKLGSKGVENFSFEKAGRYAAQDARVTWLLWRKLAQKRLQRVEPLWRMFEYDMETYNVFMRGEHHGITVDRATIRRLRSEYESRVKGVLAQLIVDYDRPADFNPNATAQIRKLLYEDLRAPVTKMTKGGKDGEGPKLPSTDAETLGKLAAKGKRYSHAAQLLLDYAEVNKILGTYLIGLDHRLDDDLRLHPDFLLHGTETSRTSCVTGDTLVLTARGELPITDVVVGDLVLTHLGRWRRVVAWLDQGWRPVSQIRFASGDTLRCTGDHRLHTPTGWVYARDLTIGTEVDHASIEEVRVERGQRAEGCCLLHEQGSPHDAGGGSETRHLVPQRAADSGRPSHGRAASARSVHPVQPGGVWRPEPDGRASGGEAPPVQGVDNITGRIQHEACSEWEARSGASPVVGRDARHPCAPSMGHGASHRRQQDEQRAGQSGGSDQGWAQPTARSSTRVDAVVALGIEHVFDLTVEEDHSYVANRVVNHNCREPNIQNIPRESDLRHLFTPPPGCVFVIGDYDQIELRLIAYLSGDPKLSQLFITGADVHRGTAALVLNKPFEDVTPEERQDFGKMPNFLLGYGGGATNLADKTGISVEHAKDVLAAYYKQYARIRPWKERVIREAKDRARFKQVDGRRVMTRPPYVETMLGRRRRLPELFWGGNDDSDRKRAAAERQAVNTITQGAASETAKLAMNAIQRFSDSNHYPMQIVINVHDELVAVVPEKHADEAAVVFKELMSGVVVPHTGEKPLGDRIPLAVKVGVHDKWEK